MAGNRKPIVVVAAVIERGGRFLICQRRHDDTHPLKWEFPGGKVEHGETHQAALVRELREELAIEARIGRRITSLSAHYWSRPAFRLYFYHVTDFEGEPVNRAFEQIAWVEPQALAGYDFLDADAALVRRLALG